MSRRFGISPNSAQAQLQKHTVLPAHQRAGLPLPHPTAPAPFRATPADLGIADATPLTFLAFGDSGGVKDPHPQAHVAEAMRSHPGTAPDFLYHVGDLVYFHGDEIDYASQFYEPYAHLNHAIIGIPGNHDGDNSDDPSVPSLSAWMANLCSREPALPPGADEFNRDTQTQPNCYWTLSAREVTIIGCYSNVPSGGVIAPDQASWLSSELAAAPAGVPLIVALHHPPYSADGAHGGSAEMGAVLDSAFSSSGRVPDLVLSGHVHNYQRFTRTLPDTGRELSYVVIGNGGYHNLHRLAPGAVAGAELRAGVVFEAGDDSHWGYLSLVADGATIRGEYNSVSKDGAATLAVDAFTIQAASSTSDAPSAAPFASAR
ncbi:MAG: metallophosphoesterase family protein [Solirubrobacteraceae bacterium]